MQNVARREDAEEMLGDVIRLVERPPSELFGMLDWLASSVREKEGLPVLSLQALSGAALDKALQPQEEAPLANAGYAPLNSDPPSGVLVSDPNLIEESEDIGPYIAPPAVVPAAAVATPSKAVSVPVPVPSSPSGDSSPAVPSAIPPPPLSPRAESLEAIEI